MPETENRTLEDIEYHFSDNSKKITDCKIARTFTKQSTQGNSRDVECENCMELESGHDELKNSTQIGCDNRSFVKEN